MVSPNASSTPAAAIAFGHFASRSAWSTIPGPKTAVQSRPATTASRETIRLRASAATTASIGIAASATGQFR